MVIRWHRRLRNIVAGQFVGQKLQDFIPMIHQISEEVIDKFIDSGEVELVSQFASQVRFGLYQIC